MSEPEDREAALDDVADDSRSPSSLEGDQTQAETVADETRSSGLMGGDQAPPEDALLRGAGQTTIDDELEVFPSALDGAPIGEEMRPFTAELEFDSRRSDEGKYAPKPVPLDIEIERRIKLPELRKQGVDVARSLLSRELERPLIVLPSTVFELALLACCAAPNVRGAKFFNSSSGQTSGASGWSLLQLLRGIDRSDADSEPLCVVVDTGASSLNRGFLIHNGRLDKVQSYCKSSGINLILIAEPQNALSIQDLGERANTHIPPNLVLIFEDEMALAIAAKMDESVAGLQDKLANMLAREHISAEQIWDATRADEFDALVDSTSSKYAETFLGKKEHIFRQSVVELGTRNPAQTAAIFIASYFPLLTGAAFSRLQRHLTEILFDGWNLGIEQDPEVPRNWEPSDSDASVVELEFVPRRSGEGRAASLGGKSVAAKYRSMFLSVATQAYSLVVDRGLTTYPMLLQPEAAVSQELVDLCTDYIKAHAYGGDLRSTCSDLMFRLMTGGSSPSFDHTQRLIVRYRAPLLVNEVMPDVLGAKSEEQRDEELGYFVEHCCRRIAAEHSRLVTHTRWLHQVVSSVAIVGVQRSLDVALITPYVNSAKPSHRASMTQSLIGTIITSVRGDRKRICDLLRMAARLVAELPESERDVRTVLSCQLFLRTLLIWINMGTSKSASSGDDEFATPEDVPALGKALFHPQFCHYLEGFGQTEAQQLTHARHGEVYIRALGEVAVHVFQICTTVIESIYGVDAGEESQKPLLDGFAVETEQRSSIASFIGFQATRRWMPASQFRKEDWGGEAVHLERFAEAIDGWMAALPVAVLLRLNELTELNNTRAFIDGALDWGSAVARAGAAIDRAIEGDASEFEKLWCATEKLDAASDRHAAQKTLREKRNALVGVAESLLQMVREKQNR